MAGLSLSLKAETIAETTLSGAERSYYKAAEGQSFVQYLSTSKGREEVKSEWQNRNNTRVVRLVEKLQVC